MPHYTQPKLTPNCWSYTLGKGETKMKYHLKSPLTNQLIKINQNSLNIEAWTYYSFKTGNPSTVPKPCLLM
jgi:hypothetical protein